MQKADNCFLETQTVHFDKASTCESSVFQAKRSHWSSIANGTWFLLVYQGPFYLRTWREHDKMRTVLKWILQIIERNRNSSSHITTVWTNALNYALFLQDCMCCHVLNMTPLEAVAEKEMTAKTIHPLIVLRQTYIELLEFSKVILK